MQQIPLTAVPRQGTGKGVARKMRAVGQIPAVIYGHGKPALSLSVSASEFTKVLVKTRGSLALISLTIGGEKENRLAVLQEVQTDHLGKKYAHVDFLEVKPDQEITVDLPLDFVGEALGSQQGGIFSVTHHSVSVRGKVRDIPDQLALDISHLEIGDSIHVEELQVEGDFSVVFEDNFTVASCLAPTLVAEDEEPEEGEEGAEGAEGAEGEEGAESSAAESDGKGGE